MDDKKQRTLNSVPYSLATHGHDHLDNAFEPSVTDIYLNNQNDFYGATVARLQNRSTQHGLSTQQLGTVDLSDMVLQALTRTYNIRLEGRVIYLNNVLNTTGELQFGSPTLGAEWLWIGISGGVINESLAITNPISSTGVTSGTNVSTDGYSVNIATTSVSVAVAQAISTNTLTKIVFGTINYDPSSCWSASNSRYVAQTAGIYSVKGSIICNQSNRNCKLMLYKNGSLYCALIDNNTTPLASPYFNGETDIQLVATDYLELWFYSSGTLNINTIQSFFNIKRIY